MPETYRLDVTGCFCPLPILLSVREMQNLVTGDVLELVGDDPAMLADVPEWCERAGKALRIVCIGDVARQRNCAAA